MELRHLSERSTSLFGHKQSLATVVFRDTGRYLMNTARYALLLMVMLAPSLSDRLLSADQVTWFAHLLIFVPGYDYFHSLGTRHALEELISTGITLICTIALFAVCLASSQVRSSFVRMRSDRRAHWTLTDARTRLATLALVGLVVFAWTCPNILLHDAGGAVGVVTQFFDGNNIGQGLYFDGLAYMTVSILLLARLVVLPGLATTERQSREVPKTGPGR
jgi:hypothetical protein